MVPDVAKLNRYAIMMPMITENTEINTDPKSAPLKLFAICSDAAAGITSIDDASKSPTILIEATTVIAVKTISIVLSPSTLIPDARADCSSNVIYKKS